MPPRSPSHGAWTLQSGLCWAWPGPRASAGGRQERSITFAAFNRPCRGIIIIPFSYYSGKVRLENI